MIKQCIDHDYQTMINTFNLIRINESSTSPLAKFLQLTGVLIAYKMEMPRSLGFVMTRKSTCKDIQK